MSALLSPDDALFVRALMQKESAIVLDETKDYLLDTRLDKLAKDLAIASVAELVRQARAGAPRICTSIVESLTTQETLFFRDVRPFDALRTQVLPPLIAARQTSRSLTIWSAACSTGQEPYSIAMMFLEHFPDVAKWPVRIVATDLAENALTRARQGRFQQLEVNRGLPAAYLIKYFERSGVDWQIKESVRKMVEFSRLNLLEPWPLTLRPDVVLMRNVLIYFGADTKRTIFTRLCSVLHPDGALFLGSAESPLSLDPEWDMTAAGNTTWFRPRRASP